MKCPLLVMTAARVERSQGIAYIDCLKEECAWWDKEGDFCSIQTIGAMLGGLVDTLGEIVQKMPPQEDNRK